MNNSTPGRTLEDNIKIKRHSDRARYDRGTVNSILDESMVCHVAFSDSGHVFNIPMIFARNGNRIILHASIKSRIYEVMAAGAEVSITVTIIDGIVLARSAYNSSMNYRSAIILGRSSVIKDSGKKLEASGIITEKITRGRWDDCRKPTETELRATGFVEVEIQNFSSKIREGPPVDNPEDLSLPYWSGIIPIRLSKGVPQSSNSLGKEVPLPDYLREM